MPTRFVSPPVAPTVLPVPSTVMLRILTGPAVAATIGAMVFPKESVMVASPEAGTVITACDVLLKTTPAKVSGCVMITCSGYGPGGQTNTVAPKLAAATAAEMVGKVSIDFPLQPPT